MTRSRWPVVVVLIVALLATGFTRQLAADRRSLTRSPVGRTTQATGPSLSRMNSFALALLLGGLRGPLVMFLWSNSETQKSAKDLQSVDTQIEWIRLLQPEFDSVHIFQIWNKAYNISAQMTSLSNKYLTILDSIDYAKKVDLERPDNINVIYAIGSVFSDKLGDASEKVYYNRRVRAESLPHEMRLKADTSGTGSRPLLLEAMLDTDGNLLPELLSPTLPTPLIDEAHPQDRYDGSTLSYIKQFQPFKYGLTPAAIGYCYRKRAQLLQRLAKQSHAQLSALVVDGRPPLDLKRWMEAEWDNGRRCEIRAFGKPVPAEPNDFEKMTQDIAPDVHIDETLTRPLLEQAIFGYDLATHIHPVAQDEYVAHLKQYPANFDTYGSQRDELYALDKMLAGDRDYLKAIMTPAGAERKALLAAAKQSYERAIVRYDYLILRYYVPDELAAGIFPKGVTRSNLTTTLFADFQNVPLDVVSAVAVPTIRALRSQAGPNEEDLDQFQSYITRSVRRLQQIAR